ncbi:MAG: hypothetical protein IT366_24110 [Candidatus Hydrogenedentes bacterium]|nr:hypothetical protein [Candidatus Hydrogenedentota bacterium]
MHTKRRHLMFFLSLLMAIAVYAADTAPFSALQPRPSGFTEPNGPSTPKDITFGGVSETTGVTYDIVAHFPKGSPSFRVESVKVNDTPCETYVVANQGIFNGHRVVHGDENFTVSLYANWEPNKNYAVAVEGTTEKGEHVKVATSKTAPNKRGSAGVGFAMPTPEAPYHQISLSVPKEIVQPGKVKSVEVDGAKVRDARYFNSGKPMPEKAKDAKPEGESYEGIVEGTRSFSVTAPLYWLNGSKHSMKVTVADEAGKETVYTAEGEAPPSGGYWSAEWPHSASLVVEETAGLRRDQEPVQVMVAVFADDIKKPENEVRIVTYDPTHPKAGADGWVVAPSQITNVTIWRDEKLLNSEEKDPETGALVHRYDATTTLELVFFADVAPYEKKVYYLAYGNPKAEKIALESDLKITKGERLSQTVENEKYSFYLSENSGSVETITIRGEGDPVLLEHKLETNGAVHWSPDIYSPPTPWVHISDWETPIFDQINGPLLHRTRRYAPLPHMDSVVASVGYSFYAHKPYVIVSSFMEVGKDMFVQAMRNAEIVFNHEVLKEFVWEDALGKQQTLDVESARKHPIHALEIPADTPWMALVNREKKVGFATIAIEYANGNRYGHEPSEAQPYYYVQNGPWVYISRPLVYPFGGNNFTRMMPVRAGAYYHDKNAWIPFRFAKGDDPFAEIKVQQKLLTNPLRVHEWAATNHRTPETWVMPILTMPFDEGVAGAVSGHKANEEPKKE